MGKLSCVVEVDETKLMVLGSKPPTFWGQLAGYGMGVVKPSGVRYFAMGRAKS